MSKGFKWTLVGLFASIIIIFGIANFSYSKKKEKALSQATKENTNPSILNKSESFIPYTKKTYNDTDLPARINFFQLVDITKKTYPNFLERENLDKQYIQFLATDVGKQYSKNKNWYSIKVFKKENINDWSQILVEVYYDGSYKITKELAFDTCKNIWTNIDNRVPPVIDELADRIINYENQGSSATTGHVRYGYNYHLDASHYHEGYPVVCSIRYDRY